MSQQAREAAAARSGQTEQEVPANLLQYLAWLRAHGPQAAAAGPPLLASQMPTVSKAAAACKVRSAGRHAPQSSDTLGPCLALTDSTAAPAAAPCRQAPCWLQGGFQDAFDAAQSAAQLADEEVQAAWKHPVVRVAVTVIEGPPAQVTTSKLAALQASLSGRKPAAPPQQRRPPDSPLATHVQGPAVPPPPPTAPPGPALHQVHACAARAAPAPTPCRPSQA